MKQNIEELLIKHDPKNKEKLDQLKQHFKNNDKKQKCCLCGKEIIGYGNNPYPVNLDVELVCCDECNLKKVIPARAKLMSVKLISIRKLSPSKNSILGFEWDEKLIENRSYIKVHNNSTGSDTLTGPFEYVDEYHFNLNGKIWHINEYGEMLYRSNCVPVD